MAEDSSIAPSLAERLDRLRRAATLASEGAFDDALGLLGDLPGDDVGDAERSVRVLIAEFKIAVDQSALSIEELRASKQDLLRKLDTIDRQQQEIKQLSAPLVDVWESVVAVPLIGTLSSASAKDLAKRLLLRIETASVACVILDLTGADSVDAVAAASLVKLAAAVRLMGAECLLTGIRASLTEELVSLETSIEGIETRSSLREGLKHCLAQRRDGLNLEELETGTT